SVPSLSRQYSVEPCEPKRILPSAKLAPEVISPPVSKVQRLAPVLASMQWNMPSSSPAYTAPSCTLTGALNGPALYFHFSLPEAKSSAYRCSSKEPAYTTPSTMAAAPSKPSLNWSFQRTCSMPGKLSLATPLCKALPRKRGQS